MRKPARFILFFAVACTAIPCALYLFSCLFSEKDPVKIQQAAYRQFLKSLPEAVVNHFPQEIPRDPSHIRYYYFNPDLWGQGHFEQCEIWLKLNPAEIERLIKEYTQPRAVVYQVRLQNGQYPWTNAALPSEHSGESPPKFITLHPINPSERSSFEMLRHLLTEDFMVFTSERINHMQGWVTGVAISRQRNEALYFAKLSIAM